MEKGTVPDAFRTPLTSIIVRVAFPGHPAHSDPLASFHLHPHGQQRATFALTPKRRRSYSSHHRFRRPPKSQVVVKSLARPHHRTSPSLPGCFNHQSFTEQ